MTEYDMGSGQIKVMRILWRLERATAQDILDELNREETVRRSTVQTFLKVLVKKGLVNYDVKDRTFIYYPVVEDTDVAEHAFQNFVEHVFEGSMDNFLSFFVRDKNIPPEKLKKLRQMLDEKDET